MRCLPLARPLMVMGLVHAAHGSPSTRQENVTPTSVVRNVTITGRCRIGSGTETDTIVGFVGFALPEPELPELEVGVGVDDALGVADGVAGVAADVDGRTGDG